MNILISHRWSIILKINLKSRFGGKTTSCLWGAGMLTKTRLSLVHTAALCARYTECHKMPSSASWRHRFHTEECSTSYRNNTPVDSQQIFIKSLPCRGNRGNTSEPGERLVERIWDCFGKQDLLETKGVGTERSSRK